MKNKKIILLSAAALFAVLSVVFIWVTEIFSWQKLDMDKIVEQPQSTVILDASGNIAGSMSALENRRYVPLKELPAHVPAAFIAAEDARFYKHSGIDIRRIFSALFHNIKSGSASQGASTITQQLIKLTHLSPEKTIARKAQEAYLALSLERKLDKNAILEAYINTIYFGCGAYGIGAASEEFFGKNAGELTIGEAALLAGIIKSPSGFSPREHPDAAKNRRKYVLNAMCDNGFISKTEAEAAINAPCKLADHGYDTDTNSWYLDEVMREASLLLGIDTDDIYTGGYTIKTALDTEMQSAAWAVMNDPSIYPDAMTQGALIAIDPSTGGICALTGGRNYEVQMGMNRAISSKRQTGSVIKPISTYAAAIDKYGYIPTTIVHDVSREYSGGYSPGNSSGVFNGPVTMRIALSRSLNAATVDLADTIGIENVCNYAELFGIDTCSDDRNLAFSLGAMTNGATPAEICSAYCVLANGGERIYPHTITSITDRNGNIIYSSENKKIRAIAPESAFILTDVLKTAASSGTAKALSVLDFPVAAKTGTTGLANGNTGDAWTAAYTPDIAVTVWMGHDTNEHGGMAASVSGGNCAAPACATFLSSVADSLSGRDFTMPKGLTALVVDKYLLENDLKVALASSDTPAEYCVCEYFRTGWEPSERSALWDAPLPVEFSMEKSEDGFPFISFTANDANAEYMIVRESEEGGEVITVLRGILGEDISFEDTIADTSQKLVYSVVPRNALLYETGRLLTSNSCFRIEYRPGILGNISRLWHEKSVPTPIETEEIPIF